MTPTENSSTPPPPPRPPLIAVLLPVLTNALPLLFLKVQLAPGAQMQYRLVPHIIQQPGAPPVVQLQAQPHHIQQASGGQTVIAVQPAQSQQENQQQNAEVNYSQVWLT